MWYTWDYQYNLGHCLPMCLLSVDLKTEVLPYFALARSVEEVEHSSDASVAIFTTWCLALVHVHTCLGARDIPGQALPIDTVYILIAYHSA